MTRFTDYNFATLLAIPVAQNEESHEDEKGDNEGRQVRNEQRNACYRIIVFSGSC